MLTRNLLTGEKIRLVPLLHEHLTPMAEWSKTDLELLRMSDNSILYPHTLADEEDWFNGLQDRVGMRVFPFAILSLANDKVVGECGIGGFNWQARSAELGISVGAAFRNQGYGTEAVRLILRYGFMELNLNRIELQVFSYNPRAIRSYEKAGFVEEGRFREQIIRDGQFYDMVIMSVLRRDWIETKYANP